MPRKVNSEFGELDFTLIKRNKKYYALCAYCNHELTNTSFCRLKAHRSICDNKATTSQSNATACSNVENADTGLQIDLSNLSNMDILIDTNHTSDFISDINDTEIQVVNITKQINEAVCDKENTSNNIGLREDNLIPITDSSTNKSTPSSTLLSLKRKRKKESLNTFLDKVSDEELNELHTKLCSFFFGCNIPFNVIESDHFKNFIKALRPAYGLHLPGRKALSTTLLEKEYERCLKMSKDFINPESVLLIDGWKNTSNNTKTLVTILHNAKGSAAFLNAWDVSGESETGDKITDIVNESIKVAKELYATTIYAVVSDNAAAMLKMGKNVAIWHSNCSSHTANLLAKDVMNEDLTKCVKDILKEFKHSLFEKASVDLGGTRIVTPCDTRWCTYRDSYACLLKNLHYMKRLIVDDNRFKTMKTAVKAMIFDDEFIDAVKDNVELFDPICNLINVAQKYESSLAEVAHLWLTIYLPQKFWDFQSVLER